MKRLETFNVDKSFVTEKLGVRRIALKGKDQDTSDLCCSAVKALLKINPVDLSSVDCLIVCTQNPDRQGLPQTSAIVHDKLRLSTRCAAFDISLGCSGYVYSLSIAQSFMAANGMSKGFLLTCDPYSKIIDPNDKSTSMLFGDAATVTLLSDTPTWRIGKAVFGTKGDEWQAIQVDSNGVLSMQGRAVFNFAATTIPISIQETLKQNDLQQDDVDLFVMHQASKFIVDLLRKKMRIPAEKMTFAATDYGNTVSSSIPLILEKADPGARWVVICGFGVGLSWASLVLQKLS